jgi:Ricin-type beta-trefoil lectin domain
MRIFRAFTPAAAAVLAVAGAGVMTGGSASAAPAQSVTGCMASGSLPVYGNVGCNAADGTVLNPTSITLTETTGGENVNVSYTLNCIVNGVNVSKSDTFSLVGPTAPTTQTLSLQDAVGSTDPSSCTVHGLTISTFGLIVTSPNVTATADVAVPGAIWEAGASVDGVTPDTCVDDTANGNAGSSIQVFQCNSDLAQYWVLNSAGNLVHNGDCMDQSGAAVILSQCDPKSTTQLWTVNGTGGTPGTIVNQMTGQCLTAPSAADGTAFTVKSCGASAPGQLWTAPGASAA